VTELGVRAPLRRNEGLVACELRQAGIERFSRSLTLTFLDEGDAHPSVIHRSAPIDGSRPPPSRGVVSPKWALFYQGLAARRIGRV
jgi:hypothetical protein